MKRLEASSADVGMASRIAMMITRDGFKLRGKVILSFTRPLPEAIAERAVELCESLVTRRMRDEVSGGEVPLGEDALVRWVESQLPEGFPRLKLLRVQALHVIGTMAGSGTRPAIAPAAVAPAGPPSIGQRMRAMTPPAPVALPPALSSPNVAGAILQRASSSTARIRWMRRRTVWTQQLGKLAADESLDRVVGPIAFAVRDMAARLTSATLLAIDHESFDLFGALEGKAHLEFMGRLRAEAASFAIARLAAAMGQANVPGTRAATILNGLAGALDPSGRLMKVIPGYVTATDPSTSFAEAVSAALGGQDVAFVASQLRGVVLAIDEDVRTQAAFLRRWGGQ